MPLPATSASILDYGDGHARASMEIKAHHLNSAGSLPGGAIFSLADAAFSAASNSHGTLALAINVSIAFFKAVTKGTLIAEAHEVVLNPKLATYLIDVSDEAGDLVRTATGDRLSQERGHRRPQQLIIRARPRGSATH